MASAVTIVEFDFERRVERTVTLATAKQSLEAGRFLWVDLDTSDVDAASELLDELGLFPASLRRDVLCTEPATRMTRYPDCLQLVLSACGCRDGQLSVARIDVVIGRSVFLTAHDGEVRFLSQVREDYGEDFLHFATSPGFLLYEVWDHLLADYIATRNAFEAKVATMQQGLLDGRLQDDNITHMARLSSEILRFRNVVVPTRSILADLASRKSLFVSEGTQPFLDNIIGDLQRVLADLAFDRDVLTDAQNLYMSMLSQRTNRAIHRLTVVSMVFLPLTFLAGVYGMNFKHLPELDWSFGYPLFWGVCAGIAGLLLYLLKRHRLM